MRSDDLSGSGEAQAVRGRPTAGPGPVWTMEISVRNTRLRVHTVSYRCEFKPRRPIHQGKGEIMRRLVRRAAAIGTLGALVLLPVGCEQQSPSEEAAEEAGEAVEEGQEALEKAGEAARETGESIEQEIEQEVDDSPEEGSGNRQ